MLSPPLKAGAVVFGVVAVLWPWGTFRSGLFYALVVAGIVTAVSFVLRRRAVMVLHDLNPVNKPTRPADRKAEQYDVVIMGGGATGLMQALHMVAKLPSYATIAIVEPRDPERTGERDFKVGESLIEVSSMFMTKELGLMNYMLETHATKHGLMFHWPKTTDKTTAMTDYYSLWGQHEPRISSFTLNRRIFERDLTKMAIDKGVTLYRGTVKAVDIPSGIENAAKQSTVTVKLAKDATTDDASGRTLTLKARHVVDASGRAFILGKKFDNLKRSPKDTFGVVNGSAFIRVRGVDRDKIFGNKHIEGTSLASNYYAVNHFFGTGHWCWMIPIATESRDLSIGVAFHAQVIEGGALNTREKFLQFLKHHHELLYRLAMSGEVLDYTFMAPSLAHSSKIYLSGDRWYTIGESSVNWDPFYSTGLAMASQQVEIVTEAVRQDLAGVEEGLRRERVKTWDDQLSHKLFGWGSVIWKHSGHLGHASAMSWRIYFENVLYFGMSLPFYIGQYHKFVDTKSIAAPININTGDSIGAAEYLIYKLLDEVVESDMNIGFMHTYMPGQVLPWSDYAPWDSVERWSMSGQITPLRVNLSAEYARGMWYVLLVLLKLAFRVRGLDAVKDPEILGISFMVLTTVVKNWLSGLVHTLEYWGVPSNKVWSDTTSHFNSNYRYKKRDTPTPTSTGAGAGAAAGATATAAVEEAEAEPEPEAETETETVQEETETPESAADKGVGAGVVSADGNDSAPAATADPEAHKVKPWIMQNELTGDAPTEETNASAPAPAPEPAPEPAVVAAPPADDASSAMSSISDSDEDS